MCSFKNTHLFESEWRENGKLFFPFLRIFVQNEDSNVCLELLKVGCQLKEHFFSCLDWLNLVPVVMIVGVI